MELKVWNAFKQTKKCDNQDFQTIQRINEIRKNEG